ncbi:MAG: hypothetical protein HY673_19865 [Chloroflexi bacterium]|nr:hypothetical protein [Chloroflexota bacterium]
MPKRLFSDPVLKVALMLSAVLLLAAVACSPRVETKPAAPAAPAAPAPPPAAFNQLSDQQRQSLQDFARSLSTLERDWDAFHVSYDSWFRSRSIPLEPDMEKALAGFVNKFQEVKGLVVNLSALPLTKLVTEQLFESVQDEEKAVRALRDNWRPGDSVAFQRYEESRLKVEKALQNIRTRFADLMAASEGPNKESLEKFYKPYRELETAWDKFGQDYDKWKATGQEKDPPSKALPNLVTSFRELLSKMYGLPRPLIGLPYHDLLVVAAEKEEVALVKLNDTWKPRSDEAFTTYEQERMNVRKLRSQAAAGLETLRSAGLEANRASLAAFATSFKEIDRQWDGFHAGYDSWRNPATDRSRDAIATDLTDFNGKFGGILVQARAMPQSALVRPLSEMVIAAAEKEQQALGRLQESWRSYDPAAWRSFAQEQQAAERSRRQIRGAYIDLLAKYNLSLKDLGQ